MLRKTGTGWEFENEALLEDYLQQHLQALLGLKVLAQQYTINGQICYLIAVSETGQLEWCKKFAQEYANQIRRHRPKPSHKWYLDKSCDHH